MKWIKAYAGQEGTQRLKLKIARWKAPYENWHGSNIEEERFDVLMLLSEPLTWTLRTPQMISSPVVCFRYFVDSLHVLKDE